MIINDDDDNNDVNEIMMPRTHPHTYEKEPNYKLAHHSTSYSSKNTRGKLIAK